MHFVAIKVKIMERLLKSAVIGLLMHMTVGAAEETSANGIASNDQLKKLDLQVQDIKKDTLDISIGLTQLEEKLVYPQATQISVFLALDQDDKFRLDAAKIMIDGKEVVSHIYISNELEALQHGGVQRIYMGNIGSGEHVMDVALAGRSKGNNDYQKNASYKFTKGTGAKLIEIVFAGSSSQGITFQD